VIFFIESPVQEVHKKKKKDKHKKEEEEIKRKIT